MVKNIKNLPTGGSDKIKNFLSSKTSQVMEGVGGSENLGTFMTASLMLNPKLYLPRPYGSALKVFD